MLSTLPAELRAEIFRYVLPSNDRLRRASEHGWISNLTSLLATSRNIYNESVDILYKSNSLTLTPQELRTFANSVSLSRVTNLVILDNKKQEKERSVYNFVKFLLACIAKHARHPQVEQMKLRSLTVRTSRLSYKELQQLLKDSKRLQHLKPSSRGIGSWNLSSSEGFEINLVHEQLADAWKSLQSNSRINLENVTKSMVKQGDESLVATEKLVEPYLHRAILAVRLWLATESDPALHRRLNWFRTSALAFVEPYIHQTLKPGAAGARGEKSEFDLANSVLLQVVSS